MFVLIKKNCGFCWRKFRRAQTVLEQTPQPGLLPFPEEAPHIRAQDTPTPVIISNIKTASRSKLLLPRIIVCYYKKLINSMQ